MASDFDALPCVLKLVMSDTMLEARFLSTAVIGFSKKRCVNAAITKAPEISIARPKYGCVTLN